MGGGRQAHNPQAALLPPKISFFFTFRILHVALFRSDGHTDICAHTGKHTPTSEQRACTRKWKCRCLSAPHHLFPDGHFVCTTPPPARQSASRRCKARANIVWTRCLYWHSTDYSVVFFCLLLQIQTLSGHFWPPTDLSVNLRTCSTYSWRGEPLPTPQGPIPTLSPLYGTNPNTFHNSRTNQKTFYTSGTNHNTFYTPGANHNPFTTWGTFFDVSGLRSGWIRIKWSPSVYYWPLFPDVFHRGDDDDDGGRLH